MPHVRVGALPVHITGGPKVIFQTERWAVAHLVDTVGRSALQPDPTSCMPRLQHIWLSRLQFTGIAQPLGRMQINGVASLKPCPREAYQPNVCMSDAPAATARERAAGTECLAAFELDSAALDGRLALLYRGGTAMSGPDAVVVSAESSCCEW